MKATSKNPKAAAAKVTHTPGPYFYQRGRDGCDDVWDILCQLNQRTVATITFWDEPGLQDEAVSTEANARLLAAAPDMFDALKVVVAAFDGLEITATDGPLFQAVRNARHSIALADGTLSYRAC